ncbi:MULTISPECIES: bifunctional metallophosphatase/5'-nucleotidase [Lactobacillus]
MIAAISAFALAELTTFAPEFRAEAKEVKVTTQIDYKSKPEQYKIKSKNKSLIPIQFLGINDLHGGLERTGNAWIGNTQYKNAGGAIRLAAYLNHAQQVFKKSNQAGHTFRIEAGDMVGASPSNSALLQDESTMHALKAMHFTIGTLGNHEFDEGLGEFHRIVVGGKPSKKYNSAEMKYPHQNSGLNIVISNVVKRSNNKPPYGFKPYMIKTVKSKAGKKVKIGFIGILTTTMPTLTTYKNYHPYKYLDEAQTIAKYDRILRKKGVKAIIVIAHTGVASKVDQQTNQAETSGPVVDILKKLYEIDPKNSVDLYFAGHSHQYSNATVGHTHLVQAIYSGEAYDDVIGYLNPKTHDFTKKGIKAHVFPTMSAEQDPSIKDDKKVGAIVKDADRRTAGIVNQKIGEAQAARSLTGRDHNNKNDENETGDLVVDAQLAGARQAVKAQELSVDFAMTNGGGVRAGLAVKPDKSITWGAAQDVQPFGNILDIVSMTGKEVYDVLNQQYRNYGAGHHTYLLVSGLKYDFVPTNDPKQPYKVVKVYGNDGKPIDLNKTYNVVINEFLKGGGDFFIQFKNAKQVGTAGVDTDVFVNYIKAQKPLIAPKLDRKNLVTGN